MKMLAENHMLKRENRYYQNLKNLLGSVEVICDSFKMRVSLEDGERGVDQHGNPVWQVHFVISHVNNTRLFSRLNVSIAGFPLTREGRFTINNGRFLRRFANGVQASCAIHDLDYGVAKRTIQLMIPLQTVTHALEVLGGSNH